MTEPCGQFVSHPRTGRCCCHCRMNGGDMTLWCWFEPWTGSRCYCWSRGRSTLKISRHGRGLHCIMSVTLPHGLIYGETVNHVGIFDPAVWILPLLPSVWFTSPILKVKEQYVQTVFGWEGVAGNVLSCVGDHILHRSLHSVSDQIQNQQNWLSTTNKNLGGKGASEINICRKVPLQVNFFLNYIWHC